MENHCQHGLFNVVSSSTEKICANEICSYDDDLRPLFGTNDLCAKLISNEISSSARRSFRRSVQNPLEQYLLPFMSILPALVRDAHFFSSIRLCMSMSKTSVNVLCHFSSRNVVFGGPFGFIARPPLLLLLFQLPPEKKKKKMRWEFSQAPDISHKNHFLSREYTKKFFLALIIKIFFFFVPLSLFLSHPTRKSPRK